MSAMNDLDLLAKWQKGDASAAKMLVHLFNSSLVLFFRNKTNQQDSEDLKQQVWLELAKSRPTEIPSGLKAYLLGIARHVLLHYWDKKKRVPVWDPLTTSLADLDISLSQKVAQRFGARNLLSILRRLPIDDQVLLESRYLHEMSTAELAAMYAVPEGTIKSRLSHARKRLAAAMPMGNRGFPTDNRTSLGL